MIEELEGREEEWKDTPMAARNKLLLKKWREKIKVTLPFIHSIMVISMRIELLINSDAILNLELIVL